MGRSTITTSNLTQCWQAVCPGHVSMGSKNKAPSRVKCEKTTLIGIENQENATGVRNAASRLLDLGWTVQESMGERHWMCNSCSTKMDEMRTAMRLAFGN